MTSKPAARKATAKCRLKFVPDTWREWQALDGSIKQALKPLLAKRLHDSYSAINCAPTRALGSNEQPGFKHPELVEEIR